MMDQYTRETIQRYESDLKRYEEIREKIRELEHEINVLGSILGAYERIIKRSIGDTAFKELHQKVKSAINSSPASKQATHNDLNPETRVDDLSITDIILKVISESGDDGMTAAQVFSAIQSFGIGIERRNTVYGTLSRLNTGERIKKVGKRYFSIQN